MILNDEQKAAVEYVDGPQVIIAGPGSGKTRVIISKIEHLVNNLQLAPERILAITFSNKAADEMTDRLAESFPYTIHNFNVSTFHSYCWNLVCEFADSAGFKAGVRVLNENDAWVLVRKNIEKFSLRHYMLYTDPFKYITDLLKHISKLKNEGVSIDDYDSFIKRKQEEFDSKKDTLIADDLVLATEDIEKLEEISGFYHKLQELLVSENSITFDDQILSALKILAGSESIKHQVQNRWDYILVDEFQDTNIAQIDLLKYICSKETPICVVGDPDQSIYRFRGASYASFTKFKQIYPNVKSFELTQNYRSKNNILKVSTELISKNTDRLSDEKPVRTDNDDGPKICIKTSSSQLGEAEAVAIEIYNLMETLPKDKRHFSDIAVLYRAHNHNRDIITVFDRYYIPYKVFGGKNLYDTEEIKDLYAILKCIVKERDIISLYRFLSLRDWSIPISAIKEINVYLNYNKSQANDIESLINDNDNISDQYKDNVRKAFEYLFELKSMSMHKSVSEICRYIFESTSVIKRYLCSDTPDDRQRAANLGKFLNNIASFEEFSDDKSINAFVEYQNYLIESGANDEQAEIDDDRDAVRLMTVHSAKGLEWPYVFVIGLYSRRFPSQNNKDAIPFPVELIHEVIPSTDTNISEERRLAYVAFTRAKERLYLTSILKKGTKPSVFINDICACGDSILNETAPDADYDPAFEPIAEVETIKRDIRRKIMILVDENRDINKIALYIKLLHSIDNTDLKDSDLYDIDADIAEPVADMLNRKSIVSNAITCHPNTSLKMSFSRIETYETCPMAYKFNYDLHIPGKDRHYFSFGNTIHSTFEQFFTEIQNGKKPDLDQLKKLYANNWLSDGYIINKQEEGYRREGESMIENFYNRYLNDNVIPLHLEWNFNLPVGTHFINGKVDRIDPSAGDSCKIYDYKTGKPKTQKEVDENLQLTIYAYAVREALKLNTEELGLYFLKSNEIITTKRTDAQIDAAIQKIIEIADMICARKFDPKPGTFECGRCDYSDICPAKEI